MHTDFRVTHKKSRCTVELHPAGRLTVWLLLLRTSPPCSCVPTNWTKRTSLASLTPSSSSTAATRTARKCVCVCLLIYCTSFIVGSICQPFCWGRSVRLFCHHSSLVMANENLPADLFRRILSHEEFESFLPVGGGGWTKVFFLFRWEVLLCVSVLWFCWLSTISVWFSFGPAACHTDGV